MSSDATIAADMTGGEEDSGVKKRPSGNDFTAIASNGYPPTRGQG